MGKTVFRPALAAALLAGGLCAARPALAEGYPPTIHADGYSAESWSVERGGSAAAASSSGPSQREWSSERSVVDAGTGDEVVRLPASFFSGGGGVGGSPTDDEHGYSRAYVFGGGGAFTGGFRGHRGCHGGGRLRWGCR